MSAQLFFRWSGWSLLIGGLISALFAVFAYNASPPFGVEGPVWQKWLGVVGALLIILGMPALYEVHMRKLKVWGQVGFVLLLVGLLLEQAIFNIIIAVTGNMSLLQLQNFQSSGSQISFSLASIASIDWFAIIVFILGVFLFFIGAVLFGIAMALAQIFPRWTGWTLVITAVLAVCASAQNVISNTISTAASVVFALTFSYIGYILAFQISQRSVSETGQTTSPAP